MNSGLLLSWSIVLVMALGADAAGAAATFTNPLYRGADPWIVHKDGWYYLCQSAGGGIAVWKSRKLTDRGTRAVVWRAPREGWNARQIWAPELHFVGGKWYIYYAAAKDNDNANHRMGVLEATGGDPQGTYLDRGMLYTGDNIKTGRDCRWAIDGTVFDIAGRLYFVWSGWQDERDIQYLYIAQMENPWTIATNRVKLCENDTYVWERVGDKLSGRGLHEGPVILSRNGRLFLVYSCSGSWEATYKLGMLYADERADVMDPRSWTKVNKPVFQSNAAVFGVGHCSFTKSPNGAEDWMAYHSKVSRTDGWDRVVRLQKVTWNADGFPEFGEPADGPMALPAGE